jgi:parallel beta-helix repeat protein
MSSLGNVVGIWINDVPGNQIKNNVVSANTQAGVYIDGADASGNVVQGNIIGLGPDGQKTYLPVSANIAKEDPTHQFPIGVYIQDSSNNTVGGTVAGQRNLISDNQVGVYIFGKNGSSSNNQIIGNWIGLAADGTSSAATHNQFYGVILFNAPNNTVPPDNGVPSGPSANTITGSGIANYREFSGKVTQVGQSSSTRRTRTGSGAKKKAQSSRHITHQAATQAKTVPGKAVPKGPRGMVHSRTRR